MGRNMRSNVPCPNNCGSRWWDREYDTATGGWCWKCRNCSARQPIVTRGKVLSDTPYGRMTKRQLAQIEWVKKAVISYDDPLASGSYEIKKFEVTISASQTVGLFVVTGKKGDEGTVGEVFFRSRRHIFIAPGGGLSSYDKDTKRIKGPKVIREYSR